MKNIYDKKSEETFDEYCHRISSNKHLIENGNWTTVADIINSHTGNHFSADRYRKAEKRYNTNNKINIVRIKDKDKESLNNTDVNDDHTLKLEGNDVIPHAYEKSIVSTNYEKQETTSTKEIPLSENQLSDPKELLKAHGYDPKMWEVKQASNTQTTRTTVDGNSYYYSSRITIKPKTIKDIDLDDVKDYFNNFENNYCNFLSINPKQYDDNNEFLEICLQDIHMGLLSYEQETGEDYDVAIAKQRVQNCINDIYQRCQNRKFKRIVLVLLGDILHVDNENGTTTKGTRQDIDTRPTKIFNEALNLLISVVENLGAIAPLEIVNIQGNHDRYTSFMLCKSLEMAFRNDPNITFFNGPNPRKWVRHGNVLIGYAHGDMKPNAITEWLSNECPEWSNAKYREVHLGHLHSLQTIQKIEDNKYGLIARYLPALCASSAWEHEMGYPKSQRGMMSFVWNEKTGLREIWYSNI